MNTPRSKPLVRFGQPNQKWRSDIPDGHYQQGLYDEAMILAIGRVITTFPSLEQGMIAVLDDLLGGNTPARQVFFSIVSQQARIKVMRSLLEQSSQNSDKSGWYDWVLDEFKSISISRNNYAHGLWWTLDSGRAFISLHEVDSAAMGQWRVIKLNEVEAAYARMMNLHAELRAFETSRIRDLARRNASPNTHQPQRAQESSGASHAPHASAEEPPHQPMPRGPSLRSGD